MGDKNRITHEFDDGTLEKIMRDIDSEKLERTKSWCASHPAYYGTSIQQKAPTANICRECAYYRRTRTELSRKCHFPWKDPKDYDLVNRQFLPCKGRRRDEKN